jgi:predicted ATPase
MLALPVAPDSTRSFRLDPSGFGLARCLDEILGVDRERFARIEGGLREIFPDFRSIRLEPQSAFRAPSDVTRDVPQIQVADGKGIELAFDGAVAPVPAPQVSDGILLLIAYLTVLNLPTPPRLLLVEEPENGIHPRRLQEVIGLFRAYVRAQPETQVVMTSHSPYIVDLFEPEEVYACTLRRETGGSITRLSDIAVPGTAVALTVPGASITLVVVPASGGRPYGQL